MVKTFFIPTIIAVLALISGASLAQSGASADTTAAEAEAIPQVALKTDTAFAYCALEMTGSYDQHETAFGKLYQEAMNQGIYGGMPFAVYYNSPSDTPVEKLVWDVGFVLPPGKAPAAPLALKRWDFTTMATLEYRGSFSDQGINDAYGRLFQWIGANGYLPAGPCMEIFLNTPSPDENGVLYGRVEILQPVQKAPPKEPKDANAK